MKTLNFFVLLASLLLMPFANTSAQIQKNVNTYSLEGCWVVDCFDESFCGRIDFVKTDLIYNSQIHKYQLKCYGTITGQTSGDVYTIHEVENTHGYFTKNEGMAYNHNYVWTAVIQKEGGCSPAVVVKSMYHFTKNANGELVVEFETYTLSCE